MSKVDLNDLFHGEGSQPDPARPWAPMPAQPTLADFFELRFNRARNGLPFPPGHHVIQSALMAMKSGQKEETVLACLLHDLGMWVMRSNHGWWSAQLIEPYVSEKVAWAVRYHQALRFFPDESVGYVYPEMYLRLFGPDYKPGKHIQDAYQYAHNHPWYMESRLITLYDEYSFDRVVPPSLDPFREIIGRHFRQPAEGLGYDNSPVAHIWRTIIDPESPI
jgi:hypothetical protein